MYNAQYVLFNSGENEDLFALVVEDLGGTQLKLFVPELGKVVVAARREKRDYGPEGGGLTWHL